MFYCETCTAFGFNDQLDKCKDKDHITTILGPWDCIDFDIVQGWFQFKNRYVILLNTLTADELIKISEDFKKVINYGKILYTEVNVTWKYV